MGKIGDDGEVASSDLGQGLLVDTGQGRPPEHMSTASFRILRREAEVIAWDEGR